MNARWTRLATTDRLRRSSQCFAVLGGRACVFGGELHPREPVDSRVDVVLLDGVDRGTVSTLKLANPPSPRVGSAMAAIGNTLVLFSGRGGLAMAPVEENGAVWQYAPADAVWTRVTPVDHTAPFPAGRSYHASASDGADTFFVHGGCPESGRLSDVWAFSLTARRWTELPAAPLPARGGASLAWADGRLYRMNGFDGNSEQGGSVDMLQVGQSSWATIRYTPDGVSGPSPRSVCALVSVRGVGLVTLFGEHDPSALGHAGAGKMLGDVWVLNVETERWTKVAIEGETPPPRGWFGADTDGKGLIVHGGLAEDNSRLGDVWQLEFV